MSTEMRDADFGAVSVNELGIDQKGDAAGQPIHDDPVGLRFGAWANPLGRAKWYIAKISLDVLRWAQGQKHRTEIGFLKFAVDELFDKDDWPVPMVALFLTENVNDSTDAAMQPVVIFTRKGIRFLAPCAFEAGANLAGGGDRAVLRSPNGRYELEMQDDGNLVIYDEQNGHTVRWASNSGQ